MQPPGVKTAPRRDRRFLEKDEYIVDDTKRGISRVFGGKEQVTKNRPGLKFRDWLEEEEWIDDFDLVQQNWKLQDRRERYDGHYEPSRFELKKDEYIDGTGRLRCFLEGKEPPGWAEGAPKEVDSTTNPPPNRFALEPDEYIDEVGLVHVDAVRRRALAFKAEAGAEKDNRFILGDVAKIAGDGILLGVTDFDAESFSSGAEREKMGRSGPVDAPVRRLKDQYRRDRRFVEPDEYIFRDQHTGDRKIHSGRQWAVGGGLPVLLATSLKKNEWIDEDGIVRTNWSQRDRADRFMVGKPCKYKLAPDEYIDSTDRLRVLGSTSGPLLGRERVGLIGPVVSDQYVRPQCQVPYLWGPMSQCV